MPIYLDSNVFIFAALDSGPRGTKAAHLLEKIARGEEKGATCSLAVDEVVWNIFKYAGNRELAIELGARMVAISNLEIIAVTRKDIEYALALMRTYKQLKPRDAIHSAVCVTHGIDTIVSDDADFDNLKEVKRHGLI
jgi:predicted nucleic acid-binding protein